MIDYHITMMVPIAIGMKQRPKKRPAFLPALKLAPPSLQISNQILIDLQAFSDLV
jgi:hypothetical protein